MALREHVVNKTRQKRSHFSSPSKKRNDVYPIFVAATWH